MKIQLRHAAAVFAACFALTTLPLACGSDDDNTAYADGESITIVSNDLLFPAEGATASVEVRASAGVVEATVDSDWCTVSVSGSTVTVTAEANQDFAGRTALLTITAGGARRTLPVQQTGMVLDLPMVNNGHYAPNSGDVFTTTITHNIPLTVTSPQAWIHPEMDGNTLRVAIDDNTGGHIRLGYVACACGEYRDTLNIAQYDMQGDVLGAYYMMGYYGGDPNTPTALRFDVVQRNDSLFMHWVQEQYSDAYIPLTLDRVACTLYFPANFVLKRNGTTTTYGYFYDTNGRVVTSSSARVSARLRYYESADFNGAVMREDNWQGRTLAGFLVYMSSPFTSQSILQLGSPTIVRFASE